MIAAETEGSPVHSKHLERATQLGQSRRKKSLFRKFAHSAASAVGKPWAFAAAAWLVVVWAALGPVFQFSDTWQLVINTSTTIITF